MIRQEVSIDIDRPAAEVYDFVITNYVENHAKFDPKTLSTTLDGGGPIAQGKTGKEVRKDMGRESTYDFTVTELDSEKLTFAAKGGSTTFGGTWTVRPSASGSGSTLAIRFELGFGGFMRLFEPLAGGGVRKDMQATAQRIKSLVEAKQPA
jgi:hypothetical protein